MKLELHRNVDGSGLAISVTSDVMQRTLMVPLAHGLSAEIDKMLAAEGIGSEKLILSPARSRN